MTVGNELRIKSPLVLLMALFPFSVLLFLGKPLLLGFVPIGFFSLYKYIQVRQKKRNPSVWLCLEAQDQKEKFEVELHNLLFIELADEGTSVYYLEKKQVHKRALRGSLKHFETQLKDSSIQRCHPAYLVNLSQISFVDGNSEGIRLYLRQYDEPIPVSKKYRDAITHTLLALNEQVLEKR